MSLINEIGTKKVNLINILETYEGYMLGFEENLEIKGKKLEIANRENPSWLSYYDQRRIELKTLVKYFEMEVDRSRGKLFKSYKTNHSRDLSDNAINKHIDNEDAYLTEYQLLLEVKEVYNKFEGIVDAFRNRGFALRNITEIRVAALEDAVI